jgi:hypothetical protein
MSPRVVLGICHHEILDRARPLAENNSPPVHKPGPVTRARLADIGVHTIGQLAKMPGYSLERLLGRAAGEKLTAIFVVSKRDALEVHSDCRGGEVDASSIRSAGSLG